MSAMNNSEQSDDGTTFSNSEISIPRPVRFWLMLLFNVPSILCSFTLIGYILINRTQRYSLHNHTILLILLFGLPVQLLDINFYLAFFQYGSVRPAVPVVCFLWMLADYGFYIGGLILLAWLSIERHILIFHDRSLLTRTGRFLFHYLPLILILTYFLLFYVTVNFFLPCQNTYDYAVPICGASPCYQTYGILGTWEFIGNSSIPILIEGFVSTGLVVRVQWQKRRLHRSANWRKQRRMIIQLFMVSSMNVCFNLPIYLILMAHLFGLPAEYGVQAQLYFFFLGYYVIFLFPFASLCQFPELRKRIKRKIFGKKPRQLHRGGTVAPTIRDMQMNTMT